MIRHPAVTDYGIKAKRLALERADCGSGRGAL
jgi:hypothetical protein